MNTVGDQATSDLNPWSKEELEATVEAYLEMLGKEKRGEAYNKAEMNRLLRRGLLSNRSKGSVEFRMQNISAVLNALCLTRIDGYLLAKNLGKRTFEEIKSILIRKGFIEERKYEPTEILSEYEGRSFELKGELAVGRPIGNGNPEKAFQNVEVFKRDPLVRAWVLKNADGHCEKCLQPGPFLKDDGELFLEVHHLIKLSDGGADTIENTIALCPNCHRELHYSKDRVFLVEQLRMRIPRFS